MDHPYSQTSRALGTSSSALELPEGFVFLELPIRVDLRYLSHLNFIGHPLPGYGAQCAILTQHAASALTKAQKNFHKDGYDILIYDAYRPQETVDFFTMWANDPTDQKQKEWFYPRVDKSKVFELGYIARKSGHSRGSTVDLTLIPMGSNTLPTPIVGQRPYGENGLELTFLDDGTVDMGSHFDLFDEISHTESPLIDERARAMRRYLKQGMEDVGFKNYSKEWWHFTLVHEPFPETYFSFPIRTAASVGPHF